MFFILSAPSGKSTEESNRYWKNLMLSFNIEFWSFRNIELAKTKGILCGERNLIIEIIWCVLNYDI